MWVELESSEIIESDAILSIAKVTMPQVDDLSRDAPDASVDGAMERHRPFPKVRRV